MSEQNQQNQQSPVTEQVEQAPQTEGERMANALQLFADEQVDKANETVTVPEEQAQREAEQQPGEDRSEYYARLVEKDKEIRQLRSQLKGQSEQPDYKAMIQEDPLKVMTELGITSDQLLDLWANDNSAELTEDYDVKETEEPKTNKEIEELRNELNAIKEEREQRT